MSKNDLLNIERISPSKFMRGLRPECYSDTEDRAAYILDSATLEYHLESITSRNDTDHFEVFCRKLCERTICPNLRPHTGPDGGGDSKADTETYPVTNEISRLFFIGEPNAGQERWAFAFSAKKTWSTKVRSDVKGIIETGRDYKRIFFVTSRFARDKDRARIEDELSVKYGTPVTIHDRSWIVKEIIENNRKDLAFNYLGVGEIKDDPLRLGPEDYSRTQQLEDIERTIDDPEAFRGMEQQRVIEALVAAKLSRALERPRTETDGRFLRAIRLADSDGMYRQKLEARYENIWTAFWWYDDFQFLNNSYEDFETLAIKSDHALTLEFLCNLHQLLVNSVTHGFMSRDECKFDERTKTLMLALTKIAEEKDRPNNSLEAQTSLLVLRMNQIAVDGEREKLTNIWREFAAILEKAKGLGEFNANRLVSMVEVAGQIAGNDSAYNDLVEKVAEFVSSRKGEAEGALILLNRAEQLDFSDNFEMIRLLGKAATGLVKKEYSEHLIEALKLLTLAYRSAGMLWAARASCIGLAASIVIKGEEDSVLSINFVPIMKTWAWISLELRHLPDFLFCIQLLNGALATLPLTEETKEKVEADIRELDIALGCVFLNVDETDLVRFKSFPDILEAFELFSARSALLYTLGHEDVLRKDGSLPETETDEDVNKLFSILASQPIVKNIRSPIILNSRGLQTFRTTILGMSVEINFEGSSQSILVAETFLGSLEAFFSTTIEHRVIPHTEHLSLKLTLSDEASKPSFEMDKMKMTGTIVWPRELSSSNFERQLDIRQFFAEVSGRVLATSCASNDMGSVLQKLYVDEGVQQRMAMVAFTQNSYRRVASKTLSRISDWQDLVQKSYEICATRPKLSRIKLNDKRGAEAKERKSNEDEAFEVSNHRELNVRSVIDIHAWDQARWRGTAHLDIGSGHPPCLAFLFENEESARKIFERWRERIGSSDDNEEIYLSVIRDLPQQSKYNYCVFISSNLPKDEEHNPEQLTTVASRFMVMTPQNDVTLEGFLKSYSISKSYYLLPAIFDSTGYPKGLFELSILKREITVKSASSISDRDIETIALTRI